MAATSDRVELRAGKARTTQPLPGAPAVPAELRESIYEESPDFGPALVTWHFRLGAQNFADSWDEAGSTAQGEAQVYAMKSQATIPLQ